ncbi:hypothetical protein DPMN_048908 [Dreissena polymorpha]|uniref:Uncharacterized protein n=1 Tax=Dreissena polymorpha TaxID=45954 RepID=A0A9D4DBJ6_DREPO|nr:hypothetical protein DPMN_048908 [Dreissena polymorpha]
MTELIVSGRQLLTSSKPVSPLGKRIDLFRLIIAGTSPLNRKMLNKFDRKCPLGSVCPCERTHVDSLRAGGCVLVCPCERTFYLFSGEWSQEDSVVRRLFRVWIAV